MATSASFWLRYCGLLVIQQIKTSKMKQLINCIRNFYKAESAGNFSLFILNEMMVLSCLGIIVENEARSVYFSHRK